MKKRSQTKEINKRSSKKPKNKEDSFEEDESNEENNERIEENNTNIEENEEIGDLEIKIPKLSENEFMKGSVVRIKLKDFVTYDNVEVFPGPRLNVVIGPNGSGKSTLVCALVLGLGGKPALLKKGKQLGEFVKHNKTEAIIEIELYLSKTKTVTIERKITRESNISKWKINKQNSIQTEVEKKIKELGIQVENLCQFLPQDRVGDFAKMQPKDILRETLRARDITLLEKHERLINFRDETSKLAKTIEDQKSQVQELQVQNRQRKEMVERYIERQKLVDKQILLKKKRPYIQYEEARARYVEINKEAEKLNEELEKLKKEAEPQARKINEKEYELKKVQEEKSKLSKLLEKSDSTRRDNVELYEKCEQKLRELDEDIEKAKQRAQKRQEEIQRHREDINELENELRNDRSEELLERKKEILKLLDKQKELYANNQKKISRVEQNMHPIFSELKRNKEELQQIKNIKAQKLERIRERDVAQVYEWLSNNKDHFEKEVYGPVVLEVDVKNEMHANYLEQATPAWLRTAFIVQTSDDRKKFLQEFVDKQKRKIQVVLIEEQKQTPFYKHPVNIDELKEFGIENFLDEVFEAPLPVKIALCENTSLHKVGVGTKLTDKPEITERLINDGRLSRFFTPSSQFTSITSVYGNRTTSTNRIPLRTAKLFSAGLDKNAKETLELKIKDNEEKLRNFSKEKQNLENEEVEIKKENNRLKEEGNEINKKLSNRDNLINKISNRKVRLDKLLKSNEEEDKELEKEIEINKKKIKEKMFQIIFKLRDSCKNLTEQAIKNDIVVTKEIHLIKLIKFLKQKFEEDNAVISKATMEVTKMRDQVKIIKNEALKLREIANRNAPLTEELEKEFENLPDSLDELDEELQSINLSLSTMYEQDPSIIEEYERCKKQLEELEESLKKNELIMNDKSNNIQNIKVAWVTEVKKIVKLLDQHFSRFMSHIKCTGEVRLAMDPPDDYANYGIEIRVKFRDNTNLQTLNAQLQSGGEKSVSTMLFLLSLQSIVSFPFRLVDEINQGMDPVNERMIFSQVVDISTKPGPQYFLITPKLLLDLPFQKGMTVLCVYNGPYTLTQDIFNDFSFDR